MARRSYRQHCAVARALDVVGERWTLLLVRELLCGPKRYKDLSIGLPGMGTNLLATRLRELTEEGLIERDDALYRLTDDGRALEPAILALARFGAALGMEREEGALWLANWNVVALKYAFDPARAGKMKGVLEYRIDESIVQARVADGSIETTGEARWHADVTLAADGETFLGLASGEIDPEEAEEEGWLSVVGDRRLYRASLRAFSLPTS